MKRRRILKVFTYTYLCVAVFIFSFLVYVGVNGRIDSDGIDPVTRIQKIDDYAVTKIEDASAQEGVRYEFTFTIDNLTDRDTYLNFYILHNYADVYIDDELVTYVHPLENKRISKTVGGNWIMYPVDSRFNGSEVRIVLTPVYSLSTMDSLDIYIGTRAEIYRIVINHEFLAVMISISLFLYGFVITIISIVRFMRARSSQSLMYLGIFSMMIGLWKFFDSDLSTIVIPTQPILISDIAVAMLLLAPYPLLCYFKLEAAQRYQRWLNVAIICSIVIAMYVIIMQISGLGDLWETLPVCHISLTISMIVIIRTVISEYLADTSSPHGKYIMLMFMVCIVGAIIDLLGFYMMHNSINMFFTVLAILIYIVFTSFFKAHELNNMAYIDTNTGVYNQSRCKEVIDYGGKASSRVGIMMLDLNFLKKTNDTMGHEAGDILIKSFAELIQRCIPTGSFLGRFGGDEFVAVIYDTDMDKMEDITNLMEMERQRYNRENPDKPAISYAVGCAVSDDFADCTMKSLFDVADERMYEQKVMMHKEILKAEMSHA